MQDLLRTRGKLVDSDDLFLLATAPPGPVSDSPANRYTIFRAQMIGLENDEHRLHGTLIRPYQPIQ